MTSRRRLALVVVAILALVVLIAWLSGVFDAVPSPEPVRHDDRPASSASVERAPPSLSRADRRERNRARRTDERDEAPRVVVRDLRTGDPVPELALRFTSIDETTRDLRTDTDGAVTFEIERLASIEAADSTWIAPEQSRREIDAGKTLWVARMARLHGRVVSLSEAPLRGIELRLTSSLGDDEEYHTAPRPPIEDIHWLRRHGLLTNPELEVAADGSFDVRVPVVVDLALRGRADRHFDKTVPVRLHRLESGEQTLVALRSGMLIAGFVRDETGKPVAGATVSTHLVALGRRDDVDLGKLRAVGRVAAGFDGTTGQGSVRVIRSAVTDEQGAFRLELELPPVSLSHAHTLVFAEGRSLVHRQTAGPHPALGELHLRAGRSNGMTALLTQGGEPVRGGTIRFTDLPIGHAQPSSPPVGIAEDGRFPTEWLTPGHLYRVSVRGPSPKPGKSTGGPPVKSTYLDWNAQSVIELDELNSDDLDARLRAARGW